MTQNIRQKANCCDIRTQDGSHSATVSRLIDRVGSPTFTCSDVVIRVQPVLCPIHWHTRATPLLETWILRYRKERQQQSRMLCRNSKLPISENETPRTMAERERSEDQHQATSMVMVTKSGPPQIRTFLRYLSSWRVTPQPHNMAREIIIHPAQLPLLHLQA